MNNVIIYLSLVLCVLAFNYNNCQAQEAHAALIKADKDSSYSIPSNLTEDQRDWYVKFQEGCFFADGWQEISSSILAKTPQSERTQQKILLDRLGEKIGLEWSKANDTRKIDTSMLQAWGNKLKTAAKKNPTQLSVVIASIDKEVDTLLN